MDRFPDAAGRPPWWPRWRTLPPQAGQKGDTHQPLDSPQVTIISTALPFCLAGLLVSQATSVLVICLGRALAGLCIGAMSLSLPVYLAECLRPEVRGRLGLLPTTLGNLGVLICFICGAWLDWSQVIHLIIHQSIPGDPPDYNPPTNLLPAGNSGCSPTSPLPRHDASRARVAHFPTCQKQAAF